MKNVIDYLNENPAMYVATCEGNQPRVRPFTAKAEFENKLYICTNNQKNVYKQLMDNSKVEICVSGKDGTWMRLEAKAVSDNRREARVQMLVENPEIKSMYNPDDGLFEVLYLEDATATFYSFASAPTVVHF